MHEKHSLIQNPVQGIVIQLNAVLEEKKHISLPVRNVKSCAGPRNPCQWAVRKPSWRPLLTGTEDRRIRRCGWPHFARCPRNDRGTSSGSGHSRCRTWKGKNSFKKKPIWDNSPWKRLVTPTQFLNHLLKTKVQHQTLFSTSKAIFTV